MGLVVLAMGILATAGMRRSTTDLLEQLTHQVAERMRLAVRDTLETPVRVSDMLVEGIRRGTIRIDDHDDLLELIPRVDLRTSVEKHLRNLGGADLRRQPECGAPPRRALVDVGLCKQQSAHRPKRIAPRAPRLASG